MTPQTCVSMKTLHLIVPFSVYRHNGQYFLPHNSHYIELIKHFELKLYVKIKEVSSLDASKLTALPPEIECISFFSDLSLRDFVKKYYFYKTSLLSLPKDELYMVYYPFKINSIFLAWILRRRKLSIWVRSDTNAVHLSKHMIFSEGFRKGMIRVLLNPLKSFIYSLITRGIFKNNYIFYSGNIIFNVKNHRTQSEIISCPKLNTDMALVKKELTYNIAFVGNENPRKGLSVLLSALQQSYLREKITLNIIGVETLKNKTNKTLANGLIIKFHGPVYERDAFYHKLAQNDIVVMPSFAEKQGKVQLEAMSVGAVAVCSDSGGTYCTVKNYYNGLLFTPGDSKELCHIISLLYNDPLLYESVRMNGAKYVSELSPEKQIWQMAKTIQNFYNSSIEYV